MENPKFESGNEKIKSKAELDQEIISLEKQSADLSTKRSSLEAHLRDLIHAYSKGGVELDSFKTAKELLEKRIENPTLSDKLKTKFEVLFGKEEIGTDPSEDKAEFLDRRSWATESRKYKEEGEDLRESVTDIAKEKDGLRDLMDENLSFRGGTVEGEEKAPREESIEKITRAIEGIDIEIASISDNIKNKRDEVLEAWKKENPEEFVKMQNEEKAKQKEVLFNEFLKTNPGDRELIEILKNAVDTYPGTQFEKTVRLFFVKKMKEDLNIIPMMGEDLIVTFLPEINQCLNITKLKGGLIDLKVLGQLYDSNNSQINSLRDSIKKCISKKVNYDHVTHPLDIDSRFSLEFKQMLVEKVGRKIPDLIDGLPGLFVEKNKDDLIKVLKYLDTIDKETILWIENPNYNTRSTQKEQFNRHLYWTKKEKIVEIFGSIGKFYSEIIKQHGLGKIIDVNNLEQLLTFGIGFREVIEHKGKPFKLDQEAEDLVFEALKRNQDTTAVLKEFSQTDENSLSKAFESRSQFLDQLTKSIEGELFDKYRITKSMEGELVDKYRKFVISELMQKYHDQEAKIFSKQEDRSNAYKDLTS